MKKVIVMLITVLLAFNLTHTAFAAPISSVWMKLSQDNASVCIVTDAAPSDGFIAVSYDQENLKFKELSVNSDAIGLYAYNADTPGIVKISWVAAAELENNRKGLLLFCLTFEGKVSKDNVEMVSDVYLSDGTKVSQCDAPLTDTLEQSIALGEAVGSDAFTAESLAALTEALSGAISTLDAITSTQGDIDAANSGLLQALDALEPIPTETIPDETLPAETMATEPTPTEAFPLDKAVLSKLVKDAALLDESIYTSDSFAKVKLALSFAEMVLSDDNVSQETVDEAADDLRAAIGELKFISSSPDTGDPNPIAFLLSAAAISLFAIIMLMYFAKRGDRK